MKKILIDTDVMFDLLQKKEPGYRSIAQILSKGDKLKLKVFFNASTIEKIHERLAQDESDPECREILRRIIQLGKIISPDEKIYRKAVNAPIKDLGFAIRYYTAEEHHMDYFISNHLPDKKNRKMPVLSADQFLNVI